MSSDGVFNNIDGRHYSNRHTDEHQSDGQPNDLTSSYNELNEAKQRLRLLEMKIQTLESRLARKYPDVLFLNYKNRKRILVSHTHTHTTT